MILIDEETKKRLGLNLPIRLPMMHRASNQVGFVYSEFKKNGLEEQDIFIRNEDFNKLNILIYRLSRNPNNEVILNDTKQLIKYISDEYKDALKSSDRRRLHMEQFIHRVFIPMPMMGENDNSGEDGEKLVAECLTGMNQKNDEDNIKDLRHLLKTRANPDTVIIPNIKEYAVHWASKKENIDFLKTLVKYGVDVHKVNLDGWNALHFCFHHQNTSKAEYDEHAVLLLSKGVNQNAYNNDGYTPLHLAIINKANRSVIKLLEHGADKNASVGTGRVSKYFGYTPYGLAKLYGNQEAMNILKNRGANKFCSALNLIFSIVWNRITAWAASLLSGGSFLDYHYGFIGFARPIIKMVFVDIS